MINRKDRPAAGTGRSNPSVEKTEEQLVEPQPEQLMDETIILVIDDSPQSISNIYITPQQYSQERTSPPDRKATILMLACYKIYRERVQMKRLLKITLPAFLAIALFGGIAFSEIPQERVDHVWHRIASAAGLQNVPDAVIEDKKEPNAWVSFSANTYSLHVTKGLLGILKTDDQLAGILGHETGHIKLGHYKETVGRNLLWSLLYRALGKNGAGGAVELGMTLAESGFSREQEVEADDFGIKTAARAGYDPWGLVQSMELMQQAGYETSPSGFNSHPPTERRLIHMRNTARSLSDEKS